MIEVLRQAVDIVRVQADSETDRFASGCYWLRHGFRESLVVNHYYGAYPEDLPDGATLDGVKFGAIVHDIGKTTCVTNPGIWFVHEWKITPLEWQEISEHPKESLRLIAEFEQSQRTAVSVEAYQYIGLHHERLDGGGLFKVKADGLSQVARLAAITDQIVSRCEDRAYRYNKGQFSFADAFAEVNKERGTWYDSGILDNLWQLYKNNPLIHVPGNEWIFHDGSKK